MTTQEEQISAPEGNICHKCGSLISKEAPQALCPKCVLGAAASTSVPSTNSSKQTPPPALEEVATAFPDLEILELIGVGGMGAVYRVRQKSLDREVALKILSGDLSDDPTFAERFSREGRVLARLSHPNIVAIYDFGKTDKFSFLLMEYVDGMNLRQAMQAGGFTPTESLALVDEICSALAFAHGKGILHRDIKPENILIDPEGKVKIADFGIAKLVGENEQDNITLTMQGFTIGSPHYMAPEQLETPDTIDQRADIYSLGVVLYELLTGELPLGRFAEPSKKVTLDQRVDELVMRSLEREREARFQSADEIKTQVKAITTTQVPVPKQHSENAKTDHSKHATTDTGTSSKLATLSSILTGSSIVFVIAGLVIASSVRRPSDLMEAMFWFAMALFVGIPAILGFIFGTKALGEIHRSSSSKVGLGAALFGTWAWPQVILITLAISMMSVPYIGTEEEIANKMQMLTLLCIVTVAIGIPCAISIYKWAKNGPNVKPSVKAWMKTSLGLAIICAITCIMAYLSYPYDHPNPFDEKHYGIESKMAPSIDELHPPGVNLIPEEHGTKIPTEPENNNGDK